MPVVFNGGTGRLMKAAALETKASAWYNFMEYAKRHGCVGSVLRTQSIAGRFL